ncbi:MAG: hypothetical protein PUG54_06500 [Firmicutes bacterium]|nr:hypothetical protein [Bacillota bacterium]
MKKEWSGKKTAAVICGCLGAGIILLVTFYISVFQLVRGVLVLERKYGGNIASEYYEFHNEVKNNLSYQVRFEDYEEKFGDSKNSSVDIAYPVVYGKDDFTAVNKIIQKEIGKVKSYVESVAGQLGKSEEFEFDGECYVTYMDEELLSIIYVEYGYLNDEVYESYVVSVNIDMESKMALTNTQLLDIDDEFSIDFRERCEKQNGSIELLNYYSDQNITQMLTSEEHLIIFYTPLGMEVGFNYYGGWVTVTYRDYGKYQKQL